MGKPRAMAADPDMLPEYDFSNAVRGKYAGRVPRHPRVHLIREDVGAAAATDLHRRRVRAIQSKVREIRRKMDELEALIKAEEIAASGR